MQHVLVHNVSHTDLIVGLGLPLGQPVKLRDAGGAEGLNVTPVGRTRSESCTTPTPQNRPEVFSRPKFSVFHPTSKAICDAIRLSAHGTITTLHTYVENGQEGAAAAKSVSVEDREAEVPVGFGLQDCGLRGSAWSDFHLRRSAEAREGSDAPLILSVYVPVIAQLLKAWVNHTSGGNAASCTWTLILICGAGRPRNRSHSAIGNSTLGAAELMELFVKRHYPRVRVVLLDSGGGVFQYDQNVHFVRTRLLPCVEALRRAVAARWGEAWSEWLHVTIALADGAPARLAAISASLRPFRPSFLHMWQLKTFWHEHRLFDSDLQQQSFENIETAPALPVRELDDLTRQLVDEVKRHREHFIRCLSNDGASAGASDGAENGELGSFWLRKTRKPVLAVLMVQSPGEKKPTFYRGMNVEVSMPTGSLCAERNVIGTALAANPTLRRQDLRMVAVLAVTLPPADGSSCGTPTHSACATPLHSSSCGLSTHVHKRPKLDLSQMSNTTPASRFLSGRNPISPCGACNEWLKKIAEVQPDFRVVTFPAEGNLDFCYIHEVV